MDNKLRPKILVVDDQEMNRLILNEILKDDYEIQEAESGVEAIRILFHDLVKPNLILLDVMMPEMDGLTTMNIIRQSPDLAHIPVIFVTASENEEEQGLEAGAVDYLLKPVNPRTVLLRVANHIELSRYRQQLEQMVEKKVNELADTKEKFLATMANLIEYRSMESGQHVMRTKDLSKILLNKLLEDGPYADELLDVNHDALIKAVSLHDIGKIAIPDNILLKPGRLTDEEFEIIKTHTTVGGQVIQSLILDGQDDEYMRHCYEICMSHHERWNGSGYPNHLSGTDIPLSARIVALVDVYDALVSERCYKEAFSHEKAAQIIKESAGTHLDPVVVQAFTEVEDQFKAYEETLK